MKIYLAGVYQSLAPFLRKEINNENFTPRLFNSFSPTDKVNVLESFYYANGLTSFYMPYVNYLLDSGAFTFMSGKSADNINWKHYITQYADFINSHNIDLFFELDIDSVVGYDKVLDLRKLLEDKTQKAPIPVWHKSRGLDNFIEMCETYSYVSIGGIVSKEIKRAERDKLPYFIDLAHKNGAKIHGLGFMDREIHKFKFDSVDNSNWTVGRYGLYITYQNGYAKNNKTSLRVVNREKLNIHNLKEYVKLQNYCKTL